MIHGGTRKITVYSSTFYGVAAKTTVHTLKCTGTHCNFSSATMNYPNAVFCVIERSTGHILDVSVNANSFCVQCSVMTSDALTRDRVLHYLLRQVQFYSLSFHVIVIKRIFQRDKLLIILKGVILPNTWASQQHKYLKRGDRKLVASKKMTFGEVVPNFTGQVVSSKILRISR